MVRHWLYSLAVERLERKSIEIREILERTGNDWEETLYRLVSRYFGFRVNTDPFEMLASHLPLKIIRKHSDNLLQVEALLFGTAGLLDEALFREAVKDEYYLLLSREYKVLRSQIFTAACRRLDVEIPPAAASQFPDCKAVAACSAAHSQ